VLVLPPPEPEGAQEPEGPQETDTDSSPEDSQA
jgi:hypothetical protein